MKACLDIHSYGRRLNAGIAALERAGISQRNRELIAQFKDACVLDGMSVPRMERYICCLKGMAKQLNKDFDQASKEDIAGVVMRLQEADLSPWTKYTYKIMLRRFYKWLKGNNEEYPQEVKWIRPKVKLSEARLPNNGDLLTAEEVDALTRVAINPRDKAFVAVLYESGARIGEIGSLQIGNIKPDRYGVVIHVTGKTGQRPIRIIKATPHLMTWLACHPRSGDRESALWVNLGNRHHRPVAYGTLRNLLKRLFERAGIKKRFNPHLFRHSRATHLAEHLTEFQMNHYFGWVQGSNMPATYIHMTGKSVDSKILALNGLGEQNAQQNTVPAPRACPRCETISTPDAKYCLKCGGVLDVRTAMEIEAPDSGCPTRPERQALADERMVRAVLERLREEKLSGGTTTGTDEV